MADVSDTGKPLYVKVVRPLTEDDVRVWREHVVLQELVIDQAVLNVKAHGINRTAYAKPYVLDLLDEESFTRVNASEAEPQLESLPPLFCSIAGWIASGEAREDMIGGLTEDFCRLSARRGRYCAFRKLAWSLSRAAYHATVGRALRGILPIRL